MESAINIDFKKTVRHHVVFLLGQESLCFHQILKKSHNCDPAFLGKVLKGLESDGEVVSIGEVKPFSYALRKNLVNRKSDLCTRSNLNAPTNHGLGKARSYLLHILESLPEPTPVYSQWWFAENVYYKLVRFISDRVKASHDKLAFLGSTTLGTLLSNHVNNPVHIFDIDSFLMGRLKNCSSMYAEYFHYDANNELESQFKNKYNFLFVDPPWSSTLLRTFLIRSSHFLSQDGTVAISFPPKFTRPGINAERENLLRFAEQAGLKLEQVLPNFTEYSVPPFEENAYELHEISLNEPWRTGDLFLFKKIATNGRCSRLLANVATKSEWTQFCFGTSRVFLKRDGQFEEGPPNVEPISGLEGFVCNSTSSRLSLWKKASIVSTKNCVAHATGRKTLSDHLALISKPRFEETPAYCDESLRAIKNYLTLLLHPQKEKAGADACRTGQGTIRSSGI